MWQTAKNACTLSGVGSQMSLIDQTMLTFLVPNFVQFSHPSTRKISINTEEAFANVETMNNEEIFSLAEQDVTKEDAVIPMTQTR